MKLEKKSYPGTKGSLRPGQELPDVLFTRCPCKCGSGLWQFHDIRRFTFPVSFKFKDSFEGRIPLVIPGHAAHFYLL